MNNKDLIDDLVDAFRSFLQDTQYRLTDLETHKKQMDSHRTSVNARLDTLEKRMQAIRVIETKLD